MAGNYTEGQSKVLSGVYTLIQAAVSRMGLSARGIVAYPFTANWGPVNELVTIVGDRDFTRTYNATAAGFTAAKILEHGFKGLPSRVQSYRMAASGAKKGEATFTSGLVLETLYPTDRAFTAVVKDTATGGTLVEIMEGSRKLATAEGANLEQLVAALNATEFVRVKTNGTGLPETTAGIDFTGGNNGAAVTSEEYVAFLDAVEAEATANAVAFDGTTDEVILELGVNWLRRVRTEGLYLNFVYAENYANLGEANSKSRSLNYRGLVNVGNSPDEGVTAADATIFVAARVAAIALNQSLTDEQVPYGKVPKKPKKGERIQAKEAGTLIFVQNGNQVLIDEAVNTLTNPPAGESKEFGKIRVSNALDQISRDLEAFGMEYKKGKSNTAEARQTYAATVETNYLAGMAGREVIQPGYFYEPDPEYHGADAVFSPAIDEAFFHFDITPVDSMERIYQKGNVSF